jgi:hypothetical protein
MIGSVSQIALVGLVYLGAFSRFTNGRFTPSFYQYQLSRAPNNANTRVIPFIDATLGTMLLFPRTRTAAALLCSTFQGAGIVHRVMEGKPVAPDIAMEFVAVVVALTSWYGMR